MNLRSVLQQMRCTTPTHVRRYPLRYALSMFSIAVAVAMFVSMRVTQESILRTFEGNLDAMTGGAEYRIVPPQPLTDATIAALDRAEGVSAAPVIQASAVFPDQKQAVMVLGIDMPRELKLRKLELSGGLKLDLKTLLMERNSIVIPKRLAARFGWKLGDHVGLAGPAGRVEFAIGGLLESEGPATALGGNIVFMSIPAARNFFQRENTFDRIDFAVKLPGTIEAVKRSLGENHIIEPARATSLSFEYVFIQFKTILVCICVMAGVIGLFIVYNTMSLSVVQRAKEIGTLRALGAQRGEVLMVFAGEAVLLGLVASVVGAFVGRLVADEALAHTAKTLSLMMDMGEIQLVVPMDAWLLAPIIGILAALAGAIVPARAAASLPPVAAMRPGEITLQLRTRATAWMLLGLLLIAVCIAIVWHPASDWVQSVTAIGAGLVGVALIGPQVLIWLTPFIRGYAERLSSVPLSMALDNLVKYPSRTSLTAFALGGSLSLVVAVTSLVGGIRLGIDQWIREVFVFDLMAQPNDPATSAYPSGTFPAELVDDVRRDPACAEAYGVRIRRIPFDNDEVMLIAYEAEVFRRIRVETGAATDANREKRLAQAMKKGKIAISHNLARLHHLSAGDRIAIQTPEGPREFEIDDVQTDYSWFRGVIFIDMSLYHELWKDTSLSYLDIRVRPGVNIEEFRAELTRRWSDRHGLFVYPVRQLREHAHRYTSEWFALANVQLLLAVVIGGVGVANTLLVSLLTQTRQIGLLRAIGADTGQIRRMLTMEAAILGLLGGLTGCALGLLTVIFLVSPMAVKVTGYDLPLVLPYGPMAAALAAGLVIALGAAILPQRAVSRIDILQSIGYE